MLAEGPLKTCEGRLRCGEIAGLQRLTDGLKILGAIGLRKCLPILIGATLAERGQGIEVLLRCIEVAGLQILPELRDISLPLLLVGLQLLID